MNVASLGLCQELLDLSGWNQYPPGVNGFWYDSTSRNLILATWAENCVPAYDLGYLLQKLPPVVQDKFDKRFRHVQLWINGDGIVRVAYVEPYDAKFRGAYVQSADTLENAVCKLAIELFKQGILVKEAA